MATERPDDADLPQQPVEPSERALREERERSQTALDNVREGYGKDHDNDRAAGNQSGLGSRGGARDNTSGKHSGNQ